MKKLLDLFITFFKIGLLTFGGGYAMISVIENECVNKKNWIINEGNIIPIVAMMLPSVFIEFLFQGIRASVILLMIYAILNLSKHGQKNILFYTLLILSFTLNFFFNVKAIYIIIFVIISSFILTLTKKKEVKENA